MRSTLGVASGRLRLYASLPIARRRHGLGSDVSQEGKARGGHRQTGRERAGSGFLISLCRPKDNGAATAASVLEPVAGTTRCNIIVRGERELSVWRGTQLMDPLAAVCTNNLSSWL